MSELLWGPQSRDDGLGSILSELLLGRQLLHFGSESLQGISYSLQLMSNLAEFCSGRGMGPHDVGGEFVEMRKQFPWGISHLEMRYPVCEISLGLGIKI